MSNSSLYGLLVTIIRFVTCLRTSDCHGRIPWSSGKGRAPAPVGYGDSGADSDPSRPPQSRHRHRLEPVPEWHDLAPEVKQNASSETVAEFVTQFPHGPEGGSGR